MKFAPTPELVWPAERVAGVISRDALIAHRGLHLAYAEAMDDIRVQLGDPWMSMTIEDILLRSSSWPARFAERLAFDAGGHANHQFFWKVVGGDGGVPQGALGRAIARDFGSLDTLRDAFAGAARAVEQGWVFLSLAAPETDRLEIVTLQGNASVLPIGKPGLLICDLWDHAWRADHASREAWIHAFWTIVNWQVCEARYERLLDAIARGEPGWRPLNM
jgi:Fe-Mn family superoxide dismutase